jgi:predicted DCC family thiol-disulfide oxidoreductase YuxK
MSWRLKILYDGLCPICAWEMRKLTARDPAGRLTLEDIAAPGFDPSRYGLTIDDVVGAMHGVTSDGRVLRGPDVFVEAYRLVGLRWLAAALAFRPTRPVVDLVYRAFAKLRPRWSRFRPAACEAGRCRV